MKGQVPRFKGTNDIVVRHSEFVHNVNSPGPTFTNNSYQFNPANPLLFPWLNKLSENYAEWEPLGALVCFKSTSATAIGSTNTALGKVIIASNYDPSQPAFTNSTEMENSAYATVCETSSNSIHPIECKRGTDPLDLLYVGLPNISGDDTRFHDLCTVQVATEGQQAASTIGELWVTYEFRFSKPLIHQKPTTSMISAHFSCPGIVSGLNNYMSGATANPYSSSLISGDSSGQAIFISKNGRYLILYTGEGSGVSVGVAPTTGTNCTSSDYLLNNTANQITATTSTSRWCVVHTVTVDFSNSSSRYGSVVPPIINFASVNAYKVDVSVFQIPTSLGKEIDGKTLSTSDLLQKLAIMNGVELQMPRFSSHVEGVSEETTVIEDYDDIKSEPHFVRR
jgi:hypothetical protein